MRRARARWSQAKLACIEALSRHGVAKKVACCRDGLVLQSDTLSRWHAPFLRIHTPTWEQACIPMRMPRGLSEGRLVNFAGGSRDSSIATVKARQAHRLGSGSRNSPPPRRKASDSRI